MPTVYWPPDRAFDAQKPGTCFHRSPASAMRSGSAARISYAKVFRVTQYRRAIFLTCLVRICSKMLPGCSVTDHGTLPPNAALTTSSIHQTSAFVKRFFPLRIAFFLILLRIRRSLLYESPAQRIVSEQFGMFKHILIAEVVSEPLRFRRCRL